jgi:hypothetical protein
MQGAFPWITIVPKFVIPSSIIQKAICEVAVLAAGGIPWIPWRAGRRNHRHAELAGFAADSVPVAVHAFHEGFGACIQTALGRVAANHESRGTVKEFGQCLDVILNNALVRLDASRARPARCEIKLAQFDRLTAQPGQPESA